MTSDREVPESVFGSHNPTDQTPGRQDVTPGGKLSTVGELVRGGGNRAAFGILVYLVIGIVFWSLVGFLLDYLVGTQWLVLVGAGLGLCAGVTLAYLHLQAGVNTQDHSRTGHDARNRPADV